MGFFGLARFVLPNAGVSVSEGGGDTTTTAALGQGMENLDTYAARINGTNAATSAMTLDLSLASDTAGLKLPSKAGAAPLLDGQIAFNTTTHRPAVGENGSTVEMASITGTETLTNKTLTAPKVDLIKDTSGNTVETITAGGGVQIGAPTGGDKGAGTLNATALYIQGAAVASGANLLGDTLLGVAATNITFSSIPGTYKHLSIVFSGRADGAVTSDEVKIQLNGDTGSNYNYQLLSAGNATASAVAAVAVAFMRTGVVAGASATTGVAGGGTIWLPDYASTTLFKMAKGDLGTADNTAANSFGRNAWNTWRSTAAITSIKLFPETSTNFIAGTRASLYGWN